MIDLLNYGHILSFKKASQNADLFIFGLVSDDASDAWFGSHVSNEDERRNVVESIKFIDEVMPQKTFDPLDNLKAIHKKYPDAVITLFHGNEWGIVSAKRYIESIGGHVVKLDYCEKFSPSNILRSLNDNIKQSKPIANNLISTKANTLLYLKSILQKSRIEDIFVVNVGDFKSKPELITNNVSGFYNGSTIVVRSSSKREDAFEESNAGHFTSVLNVSSSNTKEIRGAIEKVIASYGCETTDDEQVLIQRQTENVKVSGVVFTRDIQKNRPYYVINYDSSGSTDSVTSGLEGQSVWIAYNSKRDNVPEKWKALMQAVWELEDVFPGVLLDIEFAISNDKVVIFQVRPLAAAYKFGRDKRMDLVESSRVHAIEKYSNYAKDGLTLFSDMAFWNPSEIIGDNPKPLDYSLYREIITKAAWDTGLVPMGYRIVDGDLMYRFGNKPYINLEKSFEALMPNSISDILSSKLKKYYLNDLLSNPSSHDKIEFEISHNCYDFSLRSRLETLKNNHFTNEEVNELEFALKRLTINNILFYKRILNDDLKELDQLENARVAAQGLLTDSNDFSLIAQTIKTLLSDIEMFGTPQFARHARCAFMAKSLLKSLVDREYITKKEFDDFLSNINTVAVEYSKDCRAVANGELSADTFKKIYGHLRAGTYNIRSPRYDQISDLIPTNSDLQRYKELCDKSDVEKVTNIIRYALAKALADYQITELLPDDVIFFIKESTAQREHFKFIFTKTLSLVLELIKKIGLLINIETNKLSYLEVQEVYSAVFYTDKKRLSTFWNLLIDDRKEKYKINSSLILPALVSSPNDFDFVELIDSRPNFITSEIVGGPIVVLDDDTQQSLIDDKIVVIEKADPGFDWIFSRSIKGLITKYGGAASHMAIRCAEFRVPAAIGCGTVLFDSVSSSKEVLIDCKNERITILK